MNNGTCSDMVNGFNYTCNTGYTGIICDTELIGCASNPCVNNGTCMETLDGLICQCVNGYNGTTCEK